MQKSFLNFHLGALSQSVFQRFNVALVIAENCHILLMAKQSLRITIRSQTSCLAKVHLIGVNLSGTLDPKYLFVLVLLVDAITSHEDHIPNGLEQLLAAEVSSFLVEPDIPVDFILLTV